MAKNILNKDDGVPTLDDDAKIYVDDGLDIATGQADQVVVKLKKQRLWDWSELMKGMPFYDEWEPEEFNEYIEALANHLREIGGVKAEIVEMTMDAVSPEAMQRTALENVYFISRDDPWGTYSAAMYATHLRHFWKQFSGSEVIPVNKLGVDLEERNKILIQSAQKKWVEIAAKKSQELGVVIEGVQTIYKTQHNGKSPSMHKIAEILNEKKIKTPNEKGKWFAQTVKRVLTRSDTHHQK